MNMNDLVSMNKNNEEAISTIIESFEKYEWLLKVVSDGRSIGDGYVTTTENVDVIVEESKNRLNDFIIESKDEIVNLTSYDEWNRLLRLSGEKTIQKNLDSEIRRVIHVMSKDVFSPKKFNVDNKDNFEYILSTDGFMVCFFNVLRRNTKRLNQDLLDLTTLEIEKNIASWFLSAELSYHGYGKSKEEITKEIRNFNYEWKNFWYRYEPLYTLRAWKEFYILYFFQELNEKQLLDWYSQQLKGQSDSLYDYANSLCYFSNHFK